MSTFYLEPLENRLTISEANFVRKVFANPGYKLNDGEAFDESGAALWEKPEELGLIRSVGSYKWMPTHKLDVGINVSE